MESFLISSVLPPQRWLAASCQQAQELHREHHTGNSAAWSELLLDRSSATQHRNPSADFCFNYIKKKSASSLCSIIIIAIIKNTSDDKSSKPAAPSRLFGIVHFLSCLTSSGNQSNGYSILLLLQACTALSQHM